MSFLGIGNKRKAGAGVIALQSTAAGLAGELEKVRISPTFVSAYVSPHVDIDQVAKVIGFPFFRRSHDDLFHCRRIARRCRTAVLHYRQELGPGGGSLFRRLADSGSRSCQCSPGV